MINFGPGCVGIVKKITTFSNERASEVIFTAPRSKDYLIVLIDLLDKKEELTHKKISEGLEKAGLISIDNLYDAVGQEKAEEIIKKVTAHVREMGE